MEFLNASENPWIVYLVIPGLIIIARIIDVSIGTMRIILISKGMRALAGFLGFAESLVWLTATVQIMQNLDSVYNYLAYAGGFGFGTYIGVVLEGKISLGKVIVRIITRRDNTELVSALNGRNYSMTQVDAQGRYGKVSILFLALDRKQIPPLIRLINQYNPRAFYTIEDIRHVNTAVPNGKPKKPFMKYTGLKKAFMQRK